MLYDIAHIIKDKFGFLWEAIENVNGWLFACRYGKKLKNVDEVLSPLNGKYKVRKTAEADVLPLVKFFSEQPEEAFEFFKPHGFDEKAIKRIVKNKAFQTFVVEDDRKQILGYFFLRSFVDGKCFCGRMADYRARGKGIGKLMAKAIEKVAVFERLRMYASISPDNLASLESAKAVSDVRIIKTLDNGYYYIERTPKK